MKFSELNLTNLKTNFLLIQFDLKRLFIFLRKQLYIDLIFQSVDRQQQSLYNLFSRMFQLMILCFCFWISCIRNSCTLYAVSRTHVYQQYQRKYFLGKMKKPGMEQLIIKRLGFTNSSMLGKGNFKLPTVHTTKN